MPSRSPHLLQCPALITISTRASLKKYHTFNLTLGLGDDMGEWEFERIGTEEEKMNVERELQDLRERLARVEEWKRRREEIEGELAKVWVEGGNELDPPDYTEVEVDAAEESSPATNSGAKGKIDGSRDEEGIELERRPGFERMWSVD